MPKRGRGYNVANGAAFEAQIKTYPLSGLDCANCAARIETRLQQDLDPNASVNFVTSTLRISSAKVDQAQRMIDHIEPGVLIHIDTAPSGTPGAAHADVHGHHHHDAQLQLWPLITAGILFILGLIYRRSC